MTVSDSEVDLVPAARPTGSVTVSPGAPGPDSATVSDSDTVAAP